MVNILNQAVFFSSHLAAHLTQAQLPLSQAKPTEDGETKCMTWHLLKGGVRTATLNQLQNPKVLEDLFNEAIAQPLEAKRRSKVEALQ